MDALHRGGVEESLFICTTRGGTWEFVTVRDRGCALLLDGEPVTAGDARPESVERVLNAFLRVARGTGSAWPRCGVMPPADDAHRQEEPFVRPFHP